MRVAWAELSSLWNWNTKERFYFLSKEFLGPLSLFFLFLFSFLQPSPKISLTQVYVVWSQRLVSCRMTLEGPWCHRRMSSSLLAAPTVTFMQGEADSIMNHPSWSRSCYLRSIFLTVWFSFPWRVFWKMGYRNYLWCSNKNHLHKHLLQNHISRGHWLTTGLKNQGPTSSYSVARSTWNNITFELFTPENFQVKLLFSMSETASN